MARRGTKKYQATIQDRLSESEVVFYYTPPTTSDRLEFQNNFIKRNKNQIDADLIDDQVEIGLRLITGLRDGDFERDVAGEWVPLSSNPDSPHYFADWKAWLREYAPDLVEPFTVHIFNRQTTVKSSLAEVAEGK